MADACCGACGDDTQLVSAVPVEGPGSRSPWWRDVAFLPSLLSGVFLVLGYALTWSGGDALSLIATGALWISLIAGASTFVPGALRYLRRGGLGVGLLMTIAAVGAVLLGHVGEAAALAFLFSLSETLEERAMARAQAGLRALLDLIPDTAQVLRPGNLMAQSIPVAEIRTGDTLIVAAGERIATDGTVSAGNSSVDTSAITGESIPVPVSPGDTVLAGSVNDSGALRVTATADGRDNSLTRIVELVQQVQARKGVRARLADRIARPLVPLVLIAAALIALYGIVIGDPATWIERALVVLVAVSPCALAIAVPVTVISAIGSASRLGVVIKSGVAFEEFGTIRTIAFDKMGTLTANKPRVVQIVSADDYDESELVRWAAALEAESSHPLASALMEAAEGSISQASGLTETAGHGIAGDVDGRHIRVGNPRWIDPASLTGSADTLAADGMTVIVVEADGNVAGVIGVRDELRPEAAEAIDMLHDQGLRTVMLTGDNQRTAQALAQQAGIDDVRAGQLPEQKAQAIGELAAEAPTAMIGDGINDTPALATATIGIAMGATGTAAAIESADIAFTGHDLRLIPKALAHARRGRRIMTANIALALAIIIVLFPLALFGLLGLAGVVLVHEVAEIVIILNGVRAARVR